ncbi:uncharacterized protein B0H18DRAFT_603897 [Fomitopsis serialis]|uniref:uncharacterized protein n=1 Tax=Fomitopsis serialis TaxID=139415 RepID=UPI00200891B1|nr:uncharacterized protein B0H18DRAFT_603897 [Neoantrodia serialis]KAH9933875.1 hypothetical protein B0H18DRAFT_603897 [Neoantrodia serialis]
MMIRPVPPPVRGLSDTNATTQNAGATTIHGDRSITELDKTAVQTFTCTVQSHASRASATWILNFSASGRRSSDSRPVGCPIHQAGVPNRIRSIAFISCTQERDASVRLLGDDSPSDRIRRSDGAKAHRREFRILDITLVDLFLTNITMIRFTYQLCHRTEHKLKIWSRARWAHCIQGERSSVYVSRPPAAVWVSVRCVSLRTDFRP